MPPEKASGTAPGSAFGAGLHAGLPTGPHGPLLQDGAPERWLAFGAAREVFVAHALERVVPTLETVCRRVEETGAWAVGFVAYEAAPAFDPALATHPPAGALGGAPLLVFTLHPPPRRRRGAPAAVLAAASAADIPARPVVRAAARPAVPADRLSPPGLGSYRVGGWRPSLDEADHAAAIAAIHRRIERGDTYQVNLTYRLASDFTGDPRAFFRDLAAAQRGGHGGYLEIGRHAVCCASPELFFELDAGRVTTRPMKGTAPRGEDPEEDRRRAEELAASEKEQAENLMIVDMMRHDLGRVAVPGSVEVPRLFALEGYPTLWQMTSTVTARLAPGSATAAVPRLFRALFPCASITGAPKAATSRIITELETGPRGIYTGALGWIAPGGRARFSVAIRTAVVDRRAGRVEYGVGGGIVWDSTAEREVAESRLKARVLPGGAAGGDGGSPATETVGAGRPATAEGGFELLETVLWTPEDGFFLLEEHLDRLVASAAFFGWLRPEALRDEGRRALTAAMERAVERAAERAVEPAVEKAKPTGGRACPDDPPVLRLRLLAGRGGGVRVETVPLRRSDLGSRRRAGAAALPAVPVVLASRPVDPGDPSLFHKTTRRGVYESALAQAREEDAEEVLLWNPAGELTETAAANLVALLDGRLLTPPVSCALLAGTFRRSLLEKREVQEGVVRLSDLPRCEGLWLVNSVRGWRRAHLLRRSE